MKSESPIVGRRRMDRGEDCCQIHSCGAALSPCHTDHVATRTGHSCLDGWGGNDFQYCHFRAQVSWKFPFPALLETIFGPAGPEMDFSTVIFGPAGPEMDSSTVIFGPAGPKMKMGIFFQFFFSKFFFAIFSNFFLVSECFFWSIDRKSFRIAKIE